MQVKCLMKFFEGLMKYFAGKKATERTALSITFLL
jgi:hypothetical protein